jgi:LDH2 family malate/lactate/ureidoglycolate dehydrogenase
MLASLRATPAADPMHPVMAAGDPERAALARHRDHGIALPSALVQTLRELCARAGCAWHLEPALDRASPSPTERGPEPHRPR